MVKLLLELKINEVNKIENTIFKSFFKCMLCLLSFKIIKYEYLSTKKGYLFFIISINSFLLSIILEYYKFKEFGYISTQIIIKIYVTFFILIQNWIFDNIVTFHCMFFNIKNKIKLKYLYVYINFYFTLFIFFFKLFHLDNESIFIISNITICTILPTHIIYNENIQNNLEIFYNCILIVIFESIYNLIIINLINLNYYLLYIQNLAFIV